MLDKLRIKQIYDDFVSKVKLTDEEIRILDMLIDKKTVVYISMEMAMSERTVGYEIRKIKNLFKDYKSIEQTKINILNRE